MQKTCSQKRALSNPTKSLSKENVKKNHHHHHHHHHQQEINEQGETDFIKLFHHEARLPCWIGDPQASTTTTKNDDSFRKPPEKMKQEDDFESYSKDKPFLKTNEAVALVFFLLAGCHRIAQKVEWVLRVCFQQETFRAIPSGHAEKKLENAHRSVLKILNSDETNKAVVFFMHLITRSIWGTRPFDLQEADGHFSSMTVDHESDGLMNCITKMIHQKKLPFFKGVSKGFSKTTRVSQHQAFVKRVEISFPDKETVRLPVLKREDQEPPSSCSNIRFDSNSRSTQIATLAALFDLDFALFIVLFSNEPVSSFVCPRTDQGLFTLLKLYLGLRICGHEKKQPFPREKHEEVVEDEEEEENLDKTVTLFETVCIDSARESETAWCAVSNGAFPLGIVLCKRIKRFAKERFGIKNLFLHYRSKPLQHKTPSLSIRKASHHRLDQQPNTLNTERSQTGFVQLVALLARASHAQLTDKALSSIVEFDGHRS